MTPEGKTKKAFRKMLDQFEYVYIFPPVQGGYGKRGLDFHCTVNGLSLYVETKAGNNDMTEKQKDTAEEMRAARAAVFLFNDNPETRKRVYEWLRAHTSLKPIE